MKHFCRLLGFAVAVSLAAAAGAWPERKIGTWSISGDRDNCSAQLEQSGKKLRWIVSRQGFDDGFEFHFPRQRPRADDNGKMMILQANDRTFEVYAQSVAHGYWVPDSRFANPTLWPDTIKLQLLDGKKALAEFELTDVRAVVAELNRCRKQLRKIGEI